MADKTKDELETGATDNTGVDDQVTDDKDTGDDSGSQSGNSQPEDESVDEKIAKALEAQKKELNSEMDRRVNKFVKENKEKDKRIEELEKEKLDEEGKRKYEAEKLQKEIEEKKAEVHEREVGIWKRDKVTEYQLPPEAKEFINGNTEEEVNVSALKFKAVLDSHAKMIKEEIAKGSTHTPGNGASGASKNNPFAKGEHWNMMEQSRLMKENPEQARKLYQQANGKLPTW